MAEKTNYFLQYGVISNSSVSAAVDVLLEVQKPFDEIKFDKPSKYVESIWEKACAHSAFGRDVRGKGFELLVATVLIKKGLLPFYWQAEFQFVPLANFDLAFYTEELGPIVLSLKTSVRERYKQAEFEAQALKAVHRRAETYLITMESDEAENLNSKIDSGVLYGIDRAVVATSPEFDTLVADLALLKISPAPTLPVIKRSREVNNPK